MKVNRALLVLPEDVTLSAETTANYYGSAWVVWATHADGERQPVTQFASADVYGAVHWIADFEKCRHRP